MIVTRDYLMEAVNVAIGSTIVHSNGIKRKSNLLAKIHTKHGF